MFCTNCGNEIADNAVVCIKCGVPAHKEKKFCHNCGGDISENQAICIKCGVAIDPSIDKNLESSNGGQWMSIVSMITGIIALIVSLVLLGSEEWEVTDSDCGIWLLFTGLALTFGIISLVKHKAGHNFALAGTIMGGIAFLFGLIS